MSSLRPSHSSDTDIPINFETDYLSSFESDSSDGTKSENSVESKWSSPELESNDGNQDELKSSNVHQKNQGRTDKISDSNSNKPRSVKKNKKNQGNSDNSESTSSNPGTTGASNSGVIKLLRTISLPVLNSDPTSYQSWKFSLENALESAFLDSLLTCTNDELINDETFQEFYGELGKEKSNIWRRTLAGRLISSFSPDLIFLVRNNPDRFHPNLIMQMLASNFKCRDRTRIAELRSTLSSIKVDQFDGVREFCNNILSCTRELKLLGGSEVTSEYIFNLLLNRLTPEFNPIIVILEDKLDDKNTTFDYLVRRLISFERRMKSNPSGVVTANHVNNKIPDTSTSAIVCRYCREVGHTTDSCERLIRKKKREANGDTKGKIINNRRGGQKQGLCLACHSPDHRVLNCDVLKAFRTAQSNAAAISNTSPAASSTTAVDTWPQHTFDGASFMAFPSKANGSTVGMQRWLEDSGCSVHICKDRTAFASFRPSNDRYIETAKDGEADLLCLGTGTVFLRANTGTSSPSVIRLQEVWFVPNARHNLFSTNLALSKGEITYSANNSGISTFSTSDGTVVLRGSRTSVSVLKWLDATTLNPKDVKRTYPMGQSKSSVKPIAMVVDHVTDNSLERWHRRLGHLNCKSVLRMFKEGAAEGIKIRLRDAHNVKFCDPCIMAKMHRLPIPRMGSHAPLIKLEMVSIDTATVNKRGMGGTKYFILPIDHATRYLHVYLLTKKSAAAPAMDMFLSMCASQLGLKVKVLRSDGEFNSEEFKTLCGKHGIAHQLTCVDSPFQNSKAERLIRTIWEMAMSMLFDSGLDPWWWPVFVLMAVYLYNRSPHSFLNQRTPFEKWFGAPPDVSHLRRPGCVAFNRIPPLLRKKLDPKSKAMIFVGYSERRLGYKLADVTARRITFSRDVVFDETRTLRNASPDLAFASASPTNPGVKLMFDAKADSSSDDDDDPPSPLSMGRGRSHSPTNPARFPSGTAPSGHHGVQNNTMPPDDAENAELVAKCPVPTSQTSSVPSEDPKPAPRRSTRVTQGVIPARFRQDTENALIIQALGPAAPPSSSQWQRSISSAFLSVIVDGAPVVEPKHYREISTNRHSQEWYAAVQTELDALERCRTWDIVPLPPGRRTVSSKWCFKLKALSDGSLDKFKARLVARGFTQIKDIDYTDTFAPVAHMASVRVIMALICLLGMTMDHMDVSTAFLNGNLEEEIYMSVPEGLILPSRLQGQVLRLRRGLYGLKQSPRAWNAKINAFLLSLGFTACTFDPCIYIMHLDNGGLFFIILFVDDLILATTNENKKKEIKTALMEQYRMTDLGKAEWFLGIKITYNVTTGLLHLDQHRYIEQVLERFGMSDCMPVATPALERSNNLPNDGAYSLDVPAPDNYLSAVGALMYLAMVTRLDIALATISVARHSHEPKMRHWTAVKRIMRYLAGTRSLCITYDRNARGGLEPHAFVDANYGCNALDTCTCDDQEVILPSVASPIGTAAADISQCKFRRAVSGYVIFLGGGPVCFKSKSQGSTAHSTSEAEYVAAGLVSKECLWLRSLLHELSISPSSPTLIREDNQGAIKMANNPTSHGRTKHIDIAHHVLREHVAKGKVRFEFVAGSSNVADIFTKHLGRVLFQKFRLSLLQELPN